MVLYLLLVIDRRGRRRAASRVGHCGWRVAVGQLVLHSALLHVHDHRDVERRRRHRLLRRRHHRRSTGQRGRASFGRRAASAGRGRGAGAGRWWPRRRARLARRAAGPPALDVRARRRRCASTRSRRLARRFEQRLAGARPVPTATRASTSSTMPSSCSSGPGLPAEDRRVLQVFVAQLDAALAHRSLAAQAASASALAEADFLRTAILRAVSHDLRTPLSSIKAAATSLLEQDVEWSSDDRLDFLHTIDEETDRLNRLVGNLLDMSRLEAGAVRAQIQSVAPRGGRAARPRRASRRATASRSRFLRHSRRCSPIPPCSNGRSPISSPTRCGTRRRPAGARRGGCVRAAHRPSRDRLGSRRAGNRSAIASSNRSSASATTRTDSGVGLGLAVARGFVRAMGGELELEDTPGGGLTAIISLPVRRSRPDPMVPA